MYRSTEQRCRSTEQKVPQHGRGGAEARNRRCWSTERYGWSGWQGLIGISGDGGTLICRYYFLILTFKLPFEDRFGTQCGSWSRQTLQLYLQSALLADAHCPSNARSVNGPGGQCLIFLIMVWFSTGWPPSSVTVSSLASSSAEMSCHGDVVMFLLMPKSADHIWYRRVHFGSSPRAGMMVAKSMLTLSKAVPLVAILQCSITRPFARTWAITSMQHSEAALGLAVSNSPASKINHFPGETPYLKLMVWSFWRIFWMTALFEGSERSGWKGFSWIFQMTILADFFLHTQIYSHSFSIQWVD